MTYSQNIHIPVLLGSIIDSIQKEFTHSTQPLHVFDGTFGGGGYTQGVINGCQEVGIELGSIMVSDLDSHAKQFVASIRHESISFFHGSFVDALQSVKDSSLDIIMLDLGFSTNQLELSDIGLSYKQTDQVLDLRYNIEEGKPVYILIQEMKDESELGRILFTYSGETFSRRIAREIMELDVVKNKQKVYNYHIIEAVKKAVPLKYHKKINSILSRVYQAFRILVNNELELLEKAMGLIPQKLTKGGIVYIVSFHSLEDKIVAKSMRSVSRPHVVDEYGNTESYFELLTKKGIAPSEWEREKNPKSRSALLRILKRL